MNLSQLIYPFYWCICRSFPSCHYYKQSQNEYSYTSLPGHMWLTPGFTYSVELLSCRAQHLLPDNAKALPREVIPASAPSCSLNEFWCSPLLLFFLVALGLHCFTWASPSYNEEGATLHCSEWASHFSGFSRYKALVPGTQPSVEACRLSSCGTWAKLLRAMWNLGIKPVPLYRKAQDSPFLPNWYSQI